MIGAPNAAGPHTSGSSRGAGWAGCGGVSGAAGALTVVSPTVKLKVPSTGWPSAETTRHSTL
jgi:hypothetical protein